MRILRQFLPFYNDRPAKAKIKALVFHCSAYHTQDMIQILSDEKLSAHYIIDTNGLVTQLIKENKRAWHAGVSRWRNMENLNHYSIGIELSSLSMGQEEYPEQQIRSAISLARQIIRHYQIPPYNIVAHSDIAPNRKADPGMAFPWKTFAQKKVGLWYDLRDADKITENDIAVLLQRIGYDTTDLSAAAYAFCRRFVPHIIPKIPDKDILQQQVYPHNFVFPPEFLPILKACAYKYTKVSRHA